MTMSVFLVGQWTAQRERLPEVKRALVKIEEHVRGEHPSVRGLRCFRVSAGDQAVPAFVWMEEFESLTAYEEGDKAEYTPSCDEVWAPIYAAAVPGTFKWSFYGDEARGGWFDR
jgi:hypothetical protein